MAKRKGTPKTGGRTKGTKNKFTGAVKEAFRAVFDEIGHTKHLKAWALKNPTDFYKILSKLIPQEITGENGKPIQHEHNLPGWMKDVMPKGEEK